MPLKGYSSGKDLFLKTSKAFGQYLCDKDEGPQDTGGTADCQGKHLLNGRITL